MSYNLFKVWLSLLDLEGGAKQFVQVVTRTRLVVQVVTCPEFHHQIISTCIILGWISRKVLARSQAQI